MTAAEAWETVSIVVILVAMRMLGIRLRRVSRYALPLFVGGMLLEVVARSTDAASARLPAAALVQTLAYLACVATLGVNAYAVMSRKTQR